MTTGRIVRAVLASRLADALEVWSQEARLEGGVTGREITVLHDLLDTVGGEIEEVLGGPAPQGTPVPATPVALRELAQGLAGLSADLRRFQQWARGGGDRHVRNQAACVARRTDEYYRLVEELAGRRHGDAGVTGRGVSGVPGAGVGADPGFRFLQPLVLPAAAHPHPGGGERPARGLRSRDLPDRKEVTE